MFDFFSSSSCGSHASLGPTLTTSHDCQNFKLVFKNFKKTNLTSVLPDLNSALWVRITSKRHVRSSMFTATFNLVSRVRNQNTVFGIMKDGSLVINTLTSFNRFTAETSFKVMPTIF